MSHVHTIVRRGSALSVGFLIGLAGVAPAFAATLDERLTPSNLILLGSLILLGIGLALKVLARQRALDAVPDSPDLRWWHNP